MDNGKLNGVVFLDIKKAFDSINHGILLNKMKKRFGISSIELKWFESYLSNIEQQCSINEQLSSKKTITCGVPGVQGWRSGESTRLPPMWPGFDSQTRRHMWVEFVGSLLCTERFSPGTPVSPLLKNQYLT